MGFAELIVIAIVGLLVIGPEKLPETIKTGIVWFGRIKRVLTETRSEFEHQLGVDEIRREIHNEEVMASLEALKTEAQSSADTANQQVDEIKHIGNAIREDFEPEDEGLFGEQHGNHPPEPEDSESQISNENAPSDEHKS